ncbi:hypothetical protein [Bacillus testis]|uniref:hypothetical protein n=1 Tax=Bacillus testis TaxID=1622072 RepID=UPI00067F4F34|nr:hypothetical protein [Bacillus testis]
MYRKDCHKCKRPSFGSCSTDLWLCPICGEDLTKAKAMDAELFERVRRNQQTYVGNNSLFIGVK